MLAAALNGLLSSSVCLFFFFFFLVARVRCHGFKFLVVSSSMWLFSELIALVRCRASGNPEFFVAIFGAERQTSRKFSIKESRLEFAIIYPV